MPVEGGSAEASALRAVVCALVSGAYQLAELQSAVIYCELLVALFDTGFATYLLGMVMGHCLPSLSHVGALGRAHE